MQKSLLIWILLFTNLSFAASPLPYTTRTRAYAGWTNTVLGDIPSIGMAGALVGLGDSWTGSQLNPAGTAMTVNSTSISLTNNSFRDRYIQEYEQSIGMNTTGGVFAKYPWGFSIGFSNPHTEGASYIDTGTNRGYIASSKIKGFLVSASRLLMKEKLSLGAILSLNTATNSIQDVEESSLGLSFGLGALYQPRKKLLFGMSYHFPMTYSLNPNASSPVVSGFFQPVKTPGVFSLGAGWIPNSSFRLGVSLLFIGSTENTALLSDNSKVTGATTTLQPRIGGAYEWLDIKELSSRVFLGTYFEYPRVAGLSSRIHFTSGLEANAWIFTLGAGLDIASRYRNTFFSFGLDPIKVMRLLEFIPPESPKDYKGVLPPVRHEIDQDLPRPLQEAWDPKKEKKQENLIDIGRQIPGKIKKKMDKWFNQDEKTEKKKKKKK